MNRDKKFSSVDRFFELSLLGLVTAGFLAVAGSGFLDVPTVVLVAAGLTLRALLVMRILRFELPVRLMNLVTLSYIGFFVLDFFWVSGRVLESTVHLVCFLAVIKVLTAQTNRDYVYTAVIALVELVAAAMLSNSLTFFVYLALFLLCATSAFASAEMRRAIGRPGSIVSGASSGRGRLGVRLGMLTGFVTAGILFLTVLLFVALPRTANAAFRRFRPAGYHLTGFSSEVTLGQVGEIQKDSQPVMHVKPYWHTAMLVSDLKWRGAALSHFDGKTWTDHSEDGKVMLPNQNPLTVADEAQRSRRDGARLLYRVDLSLSDSDALFIAGIPEFLNIEHARVVRTATDSYRLGAIAGEGIRYEVSSFVPHGLQATRSKLTGAQRERYLQLPALDPRIGELAREWAGEGEVLSKAADVERHLRSEFGYSLEMAKGVSGDPLADFLFVRRKGHCEYFASAMAVMLRSLGIPARIANGFQSGTFNPVSGMYVVRASDAHSWVEAYDPVEGWVTFDPTPSAPRTMGNALLTKAGMYVDAAETFWQEWVVNYDLGRQITLAAKLEERTRRIQQAWQWMDFSSWKARAESYGAWMMGGVALAAVGLIVLRRRFLPVLRWGRKRGSTKGSEEEATVLYERMLRSLKRRGFQKPPWFTPWEFAITLPDSELGQCVTEFTNGYQALRFGGRRDGGRYLEILLERIEKL
jgi:protein-glutamine gamma-glutamyltransferase